MQQILECCIDTLEGARAAIQGGATRLEVCANLVIGGTTPSLSLVEQIQWESDIPLRAMVRPRFGDFCYTKSERQLMAEEIGRFAVCGIEGVVFGILTPDGGLDLAAMEVLICAAGSMKVTLHRAFDLTADPQKALADAEHLGVDTILTSGQRQTAWEGRALLAQLQRQNPAVTLMAGSGVSAENLPELYRETGLRAYHLSGRKVTESPMRYRKPGVSMGLPSLSEYERWGCCPEQIAAARMALEQVAVPTDQ